MAAFPDFSNMNLKDVPGHSSQDWQKLFESAAGAGFDALTGKTMEHIPIKPIYNHDEYDHMNHLDLPAVFHLVYVVHIPPCTYSVLGQFVSMQVSPPQRNPMLSTAATWPLVRKVCPLPLTCQPIEAMTQIILVCWVM